MGFSIGSVYHLAWLGRDGHIPKNARVLDFGSQNMFGSFDESTAKALFASFGRELFYKPELFADQIKIEALMEALGFKYTAFDTYSKGRTQKFDFNFDRLSFFQKGKFDLVMNLGSSEHVANQFNLFKTAHDAMKIGGIFFNLVPFFGGYNHGLYNYHPKFFSTLINNNSYTPLYWDFSPVFTLNDDGFHNVSWAHNGKAWEGTNPGTAIMNVIFKKKNDRPFQPPTDAVLNGDVANPAPNVDDIVKQMPPWTPLDLVAAN